MAKRWSKHEEKGKRKELIALYIGHNKTINEIAIKLGLAPSTIFDRLIRLGIKPQRSRKARYNNRNPKIGIPKIKNGSLAEFIGILLGDGHLTPTQVTVTLGKKEKSYALHVKSLMEDIFEASPRIAVDKKGDRTVYFGSTLIVKWLRSMGLAYNKTKSQVNIPKWCFKDKSTKRGVLRGLFDTDGSIYRLRYGIQVSFCNSSKPLLSSVRRMLSDLGYFPSQISNGRIYLTRRSDIGKYVQDIGFNNKKHLQRFSKLSKHGRFV